MINLACSWCNIVIPVGSIPASSIMSRRPVLYSCLLVVVVVAAVVIVVVVVAVAVAVVFAVVIVVVLTNSHSQVRGHRTNSSHSGVAEYPREKQKTNQKWYMHTGIITKNDFESIGVKTKSNFKKIG